MVVAVAATATIVVVGWVKRVARVAVEVAMAAAAAAAAVVVVVRVVVLVGSPPKLFGTTLFGVKCNWPTMAASAHFVGSATTL